MRARQQCPLRPDCVRPVPPSASMLICLATRIAIDQASAIISLSLPAPTGATFVNSVGIGRAAGRACSTALCPSMEFAMQTVAGAQLDQTFHPRCRAKTQAFGRFVADLSQLAIPVPSRAQRKNATAATDFERTLTRRVSSSVCAPTQHMCTAVNLRLNRQPVFDGRGIGKIALTEFVDPSISIVVQQHRCGRKISGHRCVDQQR